jgi:hypothetical protein
LETCDTADWQSAAQNSGKNCRLSDLIRVNPGIEKKSGPEFRIQEPEDPGGGQVGWSKPKLKPNLGPAWHGSATGWMGQKLPVLPSKSKKHKVMQNRTNKKCQKSEE